MISPTNYSLDLNLIKSAAQDVDTDISVLSLNEPTGNFFYDPWKIKKEFLGTIWEKILYSLKESQGEARLKILNPGTCYYSHADIDDRYHLNITGNKSYLVNLDNDYLYPLKDDGIWYKMNAGIRHSAVNFGNNPRIQLVVRKLLPINNLDEYKSIKIFLSENRHDYRYVFDDIYSPWFNKLVKEKLLNNFSVNDKEVSFDLDITLVQELIDKCPRGFKIREFKRT